ncbi:hypothetical protein Goari_026922 [Gossypium aridum]|nr:hypothetical protein [Gossypium aridum]
MPKQIPTISAAGDENNDGKASSSGTSYLTCLMKNKNIALEIMILAISLAIVGAYVKKYCQCSLE